MITKRVHIAIILVVVTSHFALSQYSISEPQSLLKIFALQKPDQDPTQELSELNNHLVYGISWRFKWKTVESQDDH